MQATIVISHKSQAAYAESMQYGHVYAVEGDFGFLASFDTYAEAYKFAKDEVEFQKHIAENPDSVQIEIARNE